MNEATRNITIRMPASLYRLLEQQSNATGKSKSEIIVDSFSNSIDSILITQRHLLPSLPGIYIVYVPKQKLLYVESTDNLQIAWNNHPKYQYFIEQSINCRIAYFSFSSTENIEEVVSRIFKTSTLEQATDTQLVTQDQLTTIFTELEQVKNQYQQIANLLGTLGLNTVVERLESLMPPRGKQNWEPNFEDQREGITKSALIKKLGFGTTADFDNAASVLGLDETEYLQELSGWQLRPIESGSTRTRFYPPQSV